MWSVVIFYRATVPYIPEEGINLRRHIKVSCGSFELLLVIVAVFKLLWNQQRKGGLFIILPNSKFLFYFKTRQTIQLIKIGFKIRSLFLLHFYVVQCLQKKNIFEEIKTKVICYHLFVNLWFI